MRRLIWGLILSVLFPALGWAQTARDSWDNLNQLQPGQKIQVVRMDLESFTGEYRGFSDDAISVRVKKDELTVPREEVMRVTLKSPKRKRNLVLGAAVGAAGGFVAGVGIAAAAGALEEGGEAGTFTAAGVMAGVGAAVGAAVGTSVGNRTIYRTKRRQ